MVVFSDNYKEKVIAAREVVEEYIHSGRIAYGTTTGFGSLATVVIPEKQTKKLQKNIILSHAVSVGEALYPEEVRAIMLMVLQSCGQGMSGIRLEVLELYREMLNRDVIPLVPAHGSVGTSAWKHILQQ